MDVTKAHTLVTLSQGIYNPLTMFQCELLYRYPGCPTRVFEIRGCECACIADMYHNTIIIVFRGTDFATSNDTLANLDFVREPDAFLSSIADVYIHSGFLEELQKVWKDVYMFVDAHIPSSSGGTPSKIPTILTTGHSLGGALALVCAVRLASCMDAHVNCYSYGAPMVGGSSFKEFVENRLHNMRHFRFENQNDIVPKLKSLKVLGYVHVGRMHYFNYKGQMKTELSSREAWIDWMYGHWQAVVRFELFDSLKDHAIRKYVEILDSILYDQT